MRRVEGFSLLELILVIAILGVLAAFVGPVVFNAMRSYDQTQRGVQTQAKMRYAIERIIHAAAITPRLERERAESARIIEVNLVSTVALLEPDCEIEVETGREALVLVLGALVLILGSLVALVPFLVGHRILPFRCSGDWESLPGEAG